MKTELSIGQYEILLEQTGVGHWEARFKQRMFYCSDSLSRILGLEHSQTHFGDFLQLIRSDYKERIAEEFRKIESLGRYEQIFPVHTCFGMKWVQSKCCMVVKDDEEGLIAIGTMQLLIDQKFDETLGEAKMRLINSLNHVGNLSHILYSFVRTDDWEKSTREVLAYLHHSFDNIKGRVILLEFNKDKHVRNSFEITSAGVPSILPKLENLSIESFSWFSNRIMQSRSIVIHNIDDLPAEAEWERCMLKAHDVSSILAVPLISRNKVWGVLGVDVVGGPRIWNHSDYLWVSAVANLVSILTEMSKIRTRLEKSQKMLQNIFDNIPVGLEIYDREGYLLDLNEKDMELFGIADKKEVCGINLFEHPVIPEEIKNKLQRKEPVTMRMDFDFDCIQDYYPSSRDGFFDLSSKINMLYNRNGELINYIAIHIDNTEQTIAYNRIAEFEHFVSEISHFAKVGYAKYNLLTGDGGALDQWYLNLGEIPGTPLNQVVGIYSNIHPDDREQIKRELRKIVRKEIDHYQGEIRVRNGQGWNWIRLNTMVTKREKPEDLVLLQMNYDITELKATEERRMKAEELDRLKSAFLANISHEIRTPLNAIVGFSTLLSEEEDSGTREDYANIIQCNNELLLGIVSDILDLAKIESGTMTFTISEFDLKPLVEEIVSSFQIRLPEGVSLIYPDFLEPHPICSDRIRLKQVLGNFITNAIKYTSEGSITLLYEIMDDEVRFSVTDTGEGMPEEVKSHVFDRFYKGRNQKQGTGLGLSICKNIIERLGGHIGVSSEVGKGSCFWCTLPIFPPKDVV